MLQRCQSLFLEAAIPLTVVNPGDTCLQLGHREAVRRTGRAGGGVMQRGAVRAQDARAAAGVPGACRLHVSVNTDTARSLFCLDAQMAAQLPCVSVHVVLPVQVQDVPPECVFDAADAGRPRLAHVR